MWPPGNVPCRLRVVDDGVCLYRGTVCEPGSGTCFHDADNGGCDDEIPCTVDSCIQGGGCSHTEKLCDDGDLCTVDFCEAETGICTWDSGRMPG